MKNRYINAVLIFLFLIAVVISCRHQKINIMQTEGFIRKVNYIETHKVSKETRKDIINGIVRKGMRKKEVRASIGKPYNTELSNVWIYSGKYQKIYFDEYGIVEKVK